jgi:hypothetical protein
VDINWKLPFEILGELFLFVLGWTLVALVALFALAIILGLIRGTTEIFAKSKREKTAKKAKPTKIEEEELIQPMLGVIEPPDNLTNLQLKRLFERGGD